MQNSVITGALNLKIKEEPISDYPGSESIGGTSSADSEGNVSHSSSMEQEEFLNCVTIPIKEELDDTWSSDREETGRLDLSKTAPKTIPIEEKYIQTVKLEYEDDEGVSNQQHVSSRRGKRTETRSEERERISSSAGNDSSTFSDRQLPCSVCGKCFAWKSNLTQHMKIHAIKNGFSCECGKTFTVKAYLTAHMKTHTDGKKIACNACEKVFSTDKYLRQHNKVMHSGMRPFVCKFCEASFKIRHKLNLHLKTHTGENPYSCLDCNLTFKSYYFRKLHLVTYHADKKPLTCAVCNKIFTTKQKLKTHKMTHTGEKPFFCSDCDKSFTTKYHLGLHSMIHTGVRPYFCNDCSKTFTTKQRLDRHTIKHTKIIKQTSKT